VLPLGLLILELADVHDLADGRHGSRGDFHQIHAGFFGQRQRLTNRDYAQLFSVFPDQANLGGGDLFVETLRFILSDGSNLQKIKKNQTDALLLHCSCNRRSIKAWGDICPRS
jgi:hypothetical protein